MVNSSQTFARFLFRLVYHCGVPESSTNREGPTAGKEHSYRTKSSISSGCTRGAKSADRRILHICGCVLFAGVQAGAAPGALPPDVYRGWFCAWVTLMNTFSREVWHSKDFLAILSGWINPLILFYLVFLIRPPDGVDAAHHGRRHRGVHGSHLDLLLAGTPGSANRPCALDRWNPDDARGRSFRP